MARRSRKAAPEAAPTDPEITEVLASGDDAAIIETAQRQADADAALLAALQERDGTILPPAPQGQTIGQQFDDIVDLIAAARRRTKLSEATLIKAWELNLMWVLNNRQQPTIPPFEYESGEEANGEVDLPVPNEVLGGEDTASEESN